MQQPLQITFRHMKPSEAVEAAIRERVEKLEHFFQRITSCHVVVEAPHRRHHQGNLYQVTVNLKLPGGEFIVKPNANLRHSHEDVYITIRDAFDAVRRQLEDYVRRNYTQTKSHEHCREARVSKIYPMDDYGFLETPEGRQVYFHRNSVLHQGFEHLDVGSQVHYFEEEGDKGPQASSVWSV